LKYRKKPVIVEATQWHKMGDHPKVLIEYHQGLMVPCVWTLEGLMQVTPGDWIITGVQGEHYPCKPDIFALTYEAAQPEQEPVAWMNNKDFEPIRVRIMQEAYELADRNDSESYNAIKVMCGDVQRMLPPKRPWVGLTEKEIDNFFKAVWGPKVTFADFIRSIEQALKEKNT